MDIDDIDACGKCSRCNKNDAEYAHTCPYDEEMRDDCPIDELPTCNCCSECVTDCVQSI